MSFWTAFGETSVALPNVTVNSLVRDMQSLNWLGSDLTHWGRATHICVSKLTIIASDNGLSPGRRQAIIWNNARILSIRLLGTNFSEILIEILTFSFKKMHLKMSSAKWQPFCFGLNVLSNGVWSKSIKPLSLTGPMLFCDLWVPQLSLPYRSNLWWFSQRLPKIIINSLAMYIFNVQAQLTRVKQLDEIMMFKDQILS